MLENLTIKFRLIFVIAFLCIVSVTVGALGLVQLGSTNASVKTLYEDRVVALGQLNTVLTLMQQNQLTLSNAANGKTDQYGKAVDDVSARIEKITAVWKAYMATYLTPQEKIVAERFAEHRGKFVKDALAPAMAALKSGESERARAVVNGPVTELFRPAQATMDELIQLQLDISKAEFVVSQSRFEVSRITALSIIVLSVLVGAAIGYWLIAGISRSLAQALTLARSVAEGDLTHTVEIHSNDEIGQVLYALRTMNAKLVSIVRQVRTGTDTIATASSQIAAGNMDLSSRTEQQASSLEETASSMEELTSTVQQNAENARQANLMAMTASTVAGQGGEVVAQVVTTMEEIRASSKRIVDIISVIDGIAFQTNILALNAAVEAARAGEQGRGFAVVAAEVRTLAQRSGAAAKEIKELINASVQKVDAGNVLVAQAGKTMGDVVQSVQQMTDVMAEIMAASQEQSTGIAQINQAVSQMDQVTQQNAALVEEAAAAAQSLHEQSATLAKEVSVFRLDPAAPGQAHPSEPYLARGATAPAATSAVVPSRPVLYRTSTTKTIAPSSTVTSSEWEEF